MKTRLALLLNDHAWVIFCVVAFALFLGTRGLNEPDEGRYAEIAREMEESGDWLAPTLNGFEHYQKPPLLYWVTALSLRLFGVHEWAARLPSALAALGVVILTYCIGRKVFSTTGAKAAAVILASAVEFFALARVLTPDMMMCLWIVAAIAAFVHEGYWLFFIAMGLGFLTKGPMALAVPLAASVSWHWKRHREIGTMPVPWLPGILLTLAISLQWFVALSIWRPGLFDYFWKYELLQRVGSHAHGRSKPWWFFVPVLALGLLPWTFFLRAALRAAWRRWREKSLGSRHWLLLGWVCVPFLLLSLSGSKLLTYILPLLPAFALAIGASLRSVRTLWAVAIPTVLCWLLVAANADLFAPYLDRQASVKTLAKLLQNEPEASNALLFTCGVRTHGFAFYMGNIVSTTRDDADIALPLDASDSARLFKGPQQCVEKLTDGPLAYGIVDRDRYSKVFRPRGWRALGQEGDFMLITNKPTSTVGLAR